MVEEPVKSTAPLGGGLARAICSYAEISFSHFPKSCPSEHRAMGQEATIRKPINESKAIRFMGAYVGREGISRQSDSRLQTAAGCILTLPPSGGSKAARTRTLESVRYVAQPFQAAGWRSFPAPQRVPACGGCWWNFPDVPTGACRITWEPANSIVSAGTQTSPRR